MALVTEQPKTFGEFVSLIEKLRLERPTPLWYRGCGEAKHMLVPTLYRHPSYKKTEQLQNMERQLLVWFSQRSIPFHSRIPAADWDALFFMQHHGVPTRLLDWTENPFISLFFALYSAQKQVLKNGSIKYKADAAIWVLRPIEWNRHALSHRSYEGSVLTPGDDALKAYTPNLAFDAMHTFPVAIYGAHNSPRIVAQRGVFTIFGKETTPMEQMYDSSGFPAGSLIKVVLKKDVMQDMRDAVLRHGITESVVYPDLQGLAQEIKRTFGFEG